MCSGLFGSSDFTNLLALPAPLPAPRIHAEALHATLPTLPAYTLPSPPSLFFPRSMASVIPPPATSKPIDGKSGHCQIVIGTAFSGEPIYCPTRVASKTLKGVAGLFLGPVFAAGAFHSLPDHKHHCRHCLRRCCDTHFGSGMDKASKNTVVPNKAGPPLCSTCIGLGVTVFNPALVFPKKN